MTFLVEKQTWMRKEGFELKGEIVCQGRDRLRETERQRDRQSETKINLLQIDQMLTTSLQDKRSVQWRWSVSGWMDGPDTVIQPLIKRKLVYGEEIIKKN